MSCIELFADGPEVTPIKIDPVDVVKLLPPAKNLPASYPIATL